MKVFSSLIIASTLVTLNSQAYVATATQNVNLRYSDGSGSKVLSAITKLPKGTMITVPGKDKPKARNDLMILKAGNPIKVVKGYVSIPRIALPEDVQKLIQSKPGKVFIACRFLDACDEHNKIISKSKGKAFKFQGHERNVPAPASDDTGTTQALDELFAANE